MFYSHQLLAKKAPLGQIWMAATMHAKINRRKLDKLNIIQICEEILNPTVPMALRLSGILMGGVVIVYERKVKLLYEDVTHLLMEINEAWKIKPLSDPTVLPKGKNKAKFEAVTLPDSQDTEIPGIELLSNTSTTIRIQQSSGFDMRLDRVEEHFIHIENEKDEDLPQNHHQADVANITIVDTFDSRQADTSLFNQFERFDIEDYNLCEEGQMNSTLQEFTLIPSPPQQQEPQQGTEHNPFTRSPPADEIQDLRPEPQNKQQSDEFKDGIEQEKQDEKRPRQTKRKAVRRHNVVMDFEQTIIAGHVYQSWLKDPSDITSKRGSINKRMKPLSTIKMARLMELPTVALISGLPEYGTGEIYYPEPLLNFTQKFSKLQIPRDSSSGGISPPEPPAPFSPEPLYNQDPLEFPVEDFHSGVDNQPQRSSLEKQSSLEKRSSLEKQSSLEKMRDLDNTEILLSGSNPMSTPGGSGVKGVSNPSSASGNDVLPFTPEIPLSSGRLKTKRPNSSSRPMGSSLPPVSEDDPSNFDQPYLKLRRLSENRPSQDQEDVLIETGPTQTQLPLVGDQPMDKITDTIRRYLKSHFDTPGVPGIESLNQLSSGMNKKKAAHLFYQTCVLATHDLVKVEQKEPYGDILIARGPKM